MKNSFLLALSLWIGLGLCGCATQDMELSNKGFQEISHGDFEQAEVDLETALALNPDNPYALLNLGVVYQENGRLDKAREKYEKLIALKPNAIAEESNSASLTGKGLVEIARENLKLLDAEEGATVAARNAGETKPQPASAKNETTPKDENIAPREPTLPVQGKTGSAPAAVASLPPEESHRPPKEAFYMVGKDDSLLDIARRKDVYGDALKWPSLFRLNMRALGNLKVTESLPMERLPEGLRLKYVSRGEASENLAAVVDRVWIVDVASAKAMKDLVPFTIQLMKKGYHAYLTKSELAGEQWIRLRVGFYKDILEALTASEHAKAFLNLSESPMPVKIGRKELERFAGY
jgi:tetratricopeptide (TPR) repeat protein